MFTGVTWTEAPTIDQTYLGVPVPFPLPAILGFEFALMAFVETKRGAETDPVKVRRAFHLQRDIEFRV